MVAVRCGAAEIEFRSSALAVTEHQTPTATVPMPAKRTSELHTQLDALLSSGTPLDPVALAQVAGHIAAHFQVTDDEVAILRVTDQGRFLHFVLPEPLQHVGQIPVSSTTTLASRTVREKRGERINNFGSARHSSVFEGVPLASGRGEPIQKIMSAPIVEAKHVIGVIQISRKGESAAYAGEDFSTDDLTELNSIAAKLAPCIKLIPGA